MRWQLCRLWANGRAELPVTMQQRAAWMHAGVWSFAAAQLPLSGCRAATERQNKNTRAWGARGEKVMDAALSRPHPAPPAAPAGGGKCSQVHSFEPCTFWKVMPRKWMNEEKVLNIYLRLFIKNPNQSFTDVWKEKQHQQVKVKISIYSNMADFKIFQSPLSRSSLVIP